MWVAPAPTAREARSPMQLSSAPMQPRQATRPLEYIAGLDGMRAIAIFGVMLFHFTAPFFASFSRSDSWILKGLAAVASVGWVGVDVFFVISGYLIARILDSNPNGPTSDYGRFIKRRAWRLLPAYVFCLALFTIAALAIKPDSKVLANSHLAWTLLTNIEIGFGDRTALGDDTFSLVHFWTLAVEWHFYLLFPWVARFAGSTTRAAWTLVAAAVITRCALFLAGASDNAVYAFTVGRLDGFAFGCLVASPALRRFRPHAGQVAWAGTLGFIALLAALATADQPQKTLPWLQTWGYSALALTAAMALFGMIHAPGRAVAAMECRFLTAAGRASYSLYVWHFVFFPCLRNATLHSGGPVVQFLLAAALGTAVTAILGAFSYRYVEARFRRQGTSAAVALNAR